MKWSIFWASFLTFFSLLLFSYIETDIIPLMFAGALFGGGMFGGLFVTEHGQTWHPLTMAHELGHYLAARSHGLTATPPFFIPFPFPFGGIGTLGAVIRIKDPIQNKRQLLDVGAAGPIAGFVALAPFLAYGIWASEVGEKAAGRNPAR